MGRKVRRLSCPGAEKSSGALRSRQGVKLAKTERIGRKMDDRKMFVSGAYQYLSVNSYSCLFLCELCAFARDLCGARRYFAAVLPKEGDSATAEAFAATCYHITTYINNKSNHPRAKTCDALQKYGCRTSEMCPIRKPPRSAKHWCGTWPEDGLADRGLT